MKFFSFLGIILMISNCFFCTNLKSSSSFASHTLMGLFNDFLTETDGYIKNGFSFKTLGDEAGAKASPPGTNTKPADNAAAKPSAPADSKPAAAAPAQSPAAATNSTQSNQTDIYKEPYKPVKADNNGLLLQGWLKISSFEFRNKEKFPDIVNSDGSYSAILVDQQNFRINDALKDKPDIASYDPKTVGDKNPKTKYDFFFRLSGTMIYYSNTDKDVNVLGSISLLDVLKSEYQTIVGEAGIYEYCFIVRDEQKVNWSLCAETDEDRRKWVCEINNHLGIADGKCAGGYDGSLPGSTNLVTKVTQPIILIPLPTPMCNQGWNYNKKGDDWECTCSTGSEQSPIDLPSPAKTTVSKIAPTFYYNTIPAVNTLTTIEGQLIEKKHLQLRYHENMLRIFHPNMGKITTPDGAVYFAEEIVFHTPSEHTINGQQYPMEMQVIYTGQTKGDISKNVVLSFLLKALAGAYNRFFDDLDVYSLPNKLTPKKDIENDLFIPKVLYRSDDNSNVMAKGFSFYTYQGSITFPPCTERTIHYVHADPIPIAKNVIAMMKEALKVPDLQDKKTGNVYIGDAGMENNRNTQPLNGRPVFFFKHDEGTKPVGNKNTGHFEMIPRKMNEYIFVNGRMPTGLPGSMVVSEAVAKGVPEVEDKKKDKSGGKEENVEQNLTNTPWISA